MSSVLEAVMAKIETSRCNLTALRKATRRVSQLYDQILATSGLRGTQRAILAYVKRSGSPTMGELAAALVLDRTALNHNLKPLERDGLLTITVDKNDRRSRLVRLTKRGEARLDESRSAWLEAQERFETAFGAGQAADLRQTLELVAALEFGERAADLPAA
ncbi:MAG: MarR family transcriptional regulator [Bradyrhizobium sp. PARBB1]|jgi:DNA-binding MarR family transcriptional regulator|nr:MarR family transcriptional regulator [Bradyrhizobium sp.]OYU61062.1 MAG: MarR family transcriptional regulator [Bradyrhizobium sp. PARBB1]PSO26857.1 MarR family transcriptional regulator [Bradyrhizobium sp. MOS004]MCA3578243.1 MarR family transcriptional regulator [Bradyrhizobium sp.]HAQ82342.1 MarR family transcriptional regulator [Bradyrhizobium sp.]